MNIVKIIIGDLKEAIKSTPQLKWILIGWAFFIIVFLIPVCGVWMNIHNWNLTAPERLKDPFNWIVIIIFLVGYFLLDYLTRKYTGN